MYKLIVDLTKQVGELQIITIFFRHVLFCAFAPSFAPVATASSDTSVFVVAVFNVILEQICIESGGSFRGCG